MGCDIHLHTEVKIDGKWYTYGTPNVRRNYDVFAKMANVRNGDGEIDPIAEPKGLPEDCSKVTTVKAEYWEADAHPHSWLGAEEICELEEWYEETFKHLKVPYAWASHLFGYSWGGFSKYPEDNPEEIEDVRFVFWFDN